MKFEPVNGYLWVEKDEKPEEKTDFLLPDDYKKVNEYCLVKCKSDDGKYFFKNSLLIVDASQVEEIKVGEDIFYIVKQQYVKGFISK